MSRNEERKPNNNYSCCVKPILTLEHGQMPIFLLSGASLLERNNLRRRMRFVDAAAKIHVGADANHKKKYYFHRPKVEIFIAFGTFEKFN